MNINSMTTEEVSKLDLVGTTLLSIVDDNGQLVPMEVVRVADVDSIIAPVLNVEAVSSHPDYPSVLYVFRYDTNQLWDVIV